MLTWFRIPRGYLPLFAFLFFSGSGPASAQDLYPVSEGGFPTFTGPPRTVHPAYRIFSLTPAGFAFKVTGMDWMSNGDLAVVTIGDTVFPEIGGGLGDVYLLKGARNAVSNAISVTHLYSGFKVPLGLAVAGDQIYVSDFNGLEKLVDRDGDGRTDTLEKLIAYPEKSTVSFGLWNANVIHSGNRFYTALGAYHYVDSLDDSAACLPNPKRGTIHETDLEGNAGFLGSGLREPNGLVVSADGELFATDNDGEWVPSNKLVHIRKGAFYGMCVGTHWDPILEYSPPAVWFPHLLRSPGQPVVVRSGIYQGQMVVGDYALLTLSRIFLEKVGGEYQGALFPFSGGLTSGALRLAEDGKGNLYLGEMEIESTEGWWYGDPKYRPTHIGYGLQKMIYTGDPVFEMLAVRATPKGFAIDFTSPAGPSASDPRNYRIQQWRHEPTFRYGGDMLDLQTLRADKADLSPDGKTVILDIPGLKADRVVHIQLHQDFRSRDGMAPWTYETWYTLNAIPSGEIGVVTPSPDSGPMTAFTVAHEAGGGIRIRVSLPEKYTLGVWNLRGKRILSGTGEGPKDFPLEAVLPEGLFTISLEAGKRSYRGLARSF
ncbi:MAG: hypothetical protein JWP91_3057 [Fibrobacteres bacterium]|nr:hypothetical protein [Fibrobacterota bacterium]